MVLLEVLTALALFGIAAAVIGAAMRQSMAVAVDMRVQIEAMNLAETALARLQTGEIAMEPVAATAFDEDNPLWTYEVAVEPVDPETPALQRVTVTVSNGTETLHPRTFTLTQWMYSPAGEDMEPER